MGVLVASSSPYLEWVLAHIDAKHQRVRYTGRAGGRVAGDRVHVQAPCPTRPPCSTDALGE